MRMVMRPAERRTAPAPTPAGYRLVLNGILWEEYEALLELLQTQRLRTTYDRGMFELKTVSIGHENPKHNLGQFVDVLTDESQMAKLSGGSVTLKWRAVQRGLEPDNCYWFGANARRMLGVDRVTFKTHPPPDLCIEVDVTHSSIPRQPIYAKLRVPELWRAEGFQVRILTLTGKGDYEDAAASLAFPIVTPAVLTRFLKLRKKHTDDAIARQFRAWVQKNL